VENAACQLVEVARIFPVVHDQRIVMGFDAAASADRAYLNYFHMILAIQ
jgi:hypothetical protein